MKYSKNVVHYHYYSQRLELVPHVLIIYSQCLGNFAQREEGKGKERETKLVVVVELF